MLQKFTNPASVYKKNTLLKYGKFMEVKMDPLNSLNAVAPVTNILPREEASQNYKVDMTQKPDILELSTKEAEPPKISRLRLMFNLLTDEQIDQINKSGKLPSNGKFIMNGMGSHHIANNFFNLRAGTQTLPEGFEVKKNVLGFAVVVPKGTEGLLVK